MNTTAPRGRARRIAILGLLGALCLAALLSFPRLRIDPRVAVTLPRGLASADLEHARSRFPDPDHVLIALPSADPFAEESLARLVALSDRFLELGGAVEEGETWTLLSPCTLDDAVLVDGALLSLPLLPASGPRSAWLRGRLEASPLLKRFFLSAGGGAWNLYLDTSLRGGALLDRLEDLRAEWPELRFAGMTYYGALQSRILEREFLPLLALASLLLLLAEWVLLGEFLTALILWAFALAPTFLLIGLFPATGTTLSVSLILAPILTLAISTSYTTHLYHGWSVKGRDPAAALRDRGDLILLDALTTALGFGSLILSPIVELRTLGLFSALGVLISLTTAILGLGAYFGLSRRPSRAQLRYAAQTQALPPPGPRQRRRLRLGWLALLLALGLAATPLGIGKEDGDLFRPGTAWARELGYFTSSHGGFEEVNLVVDTGREFGLVDLGLFEALARLEAELGWVEGVAAVYGFTDLVGEARARWEGRAGTLAPRSAEELGETLELLSGLGSGLFSRGFTNADWSSARFRIAVKPGIARGTILELLRAKTIEAGLAARASFSGFIVENSEVERLFVRGQGAGLAAFFALLIIITWRYFRSLPRAFAVAAMPATGILASLALLTLLGWRLSEVNTLALAAVAGIGVDDSLMMAAKGNSGETRRAILETTVLICSALAVLLFSRSYLIFQTALISIAGMAVSTALALFILPGLLPEPSSRKANDA